MTSAQIGRARPFARLTLAAVLVCLSAGAARAGKNNLRLLNLCPRQSVTLAGGPQQECALAQSRCQRPHLFDAADRARRRSRLSLPQPHVGARRGGSAAPHGTGGYARLLGISGLRRARRHQDLQHAQLLGRHRRGDAHEPHGWPGPDAYLTTVGAYVRKGLWLPLPAFEFGAGALRILDPNMYTIQGYAKFALQEGFHGWWLPSFAVRGSVSQLLGTSEVDMTVWGIDVLASKQFNIGGTARIEPFFGWNILFIDAKSGVIDATPACDAVALKRGLQRAARRRAPRAPHLRSARQTTFWRTSRSPSRTSSTRRCWFGGFKVKLAVAVSDRARLTSPRPAAATIPRNRRAPVYSERHAGDLLALRRIRLLTGALRLPQRHRASSRRAGAATC